jgi:hypothetical protein
LRSEFLLRCIMYPRVAIEMLISRSGSIWVRSCITTLPNKGQQGVVRQIAGAIVGMATMIMIKMLKSHNRVSSESTQMQQLHLDRIDLVTISGGNRLPMTLFSRYAPVQTKHCVANRMVGLLTVTQESKSWRKEVLTLTRFPGRLSGNGSRMVQRA